MALFARQTGGRNLDIVGGGAEGGFQSLTARIPQSGNDIGVVLLGIGGGNHQLHPEHGHPQIGIFDVTITQFFIIVRIAFRWCPKMYAASNKPVVDIEKSDGKCLNVIEHLLGKTAGFTHRTAYPLA